MRSRHHVPSERRLLWTPAQPRRLTVPLALVISVTAGFAFMVCTLFQVGLLPPRLEPRGIQIAGAAAHVMVDSPRSLILDQEARGGDFTGLTNRAELLSNLLASPPVVRRIAGAMGLREDQIAATLRLTAGAPPVMRDPDSELRAGALVNAGDRYRLDVQADAERPVIHLYTHAPSETEAVALATTAISELRRYSTEIHAREGTPAANRVTLTQLGPARGGIINAGSRPQIAAIGFVVVAAVCCALLLLGRRIVFGWRVAARGDDDAPAAQPALAVLRGGDWPRTTRVLPWMIATFMAMLWLIPFNTIELTASLPFDLKLDRLLLPFIVVTWVLALAAGGAAAPRPRATWIHFGVGAFVTAACLSVALHLVDLNQTLELPLASKKLVLLVSYLTLFVVVASSLRRTEVPAFLKYTLVLALLCAVGTIWEYRFQYNVFYSLSDQLLPGIFNVGVAETALFDAEGRALTRGPAEHPLEAVAMLTLALPIALVGLTHAKVHRDKILYGLAVCIIMAASVSTYRKSALLAPLSVCLTLAYFRRRELLRLAPLGLPAIFGISFLAPGALGSIAEQLSPEQLGVGTVSDRASDYDAVRPDVWSHLLLGRGFGSYDHLSYRVLDSEILGRLVDIGVLGLLALLLMIAVIVGTARGLIRARHPRWSLPALAVAASAVSYLVVAFLFDVSSFPHTPYILMTLAGFLAVVVGYPEDEASPDAAASGPQIVSKPTARAAEPTVVARI